MSAVNCLTVEDAARALFRPSEWLLAVASAWSDSVWSGPWQVYRDPYGHVSVESCPYDATLVMVGQDVDSARTLREWVERVPESFWYDAESGEATLREPDWDEHDGGEWAHVTASEAAMMALGLGRESFACL